MSTAAHPTSPHGHDPHLAHHFDTPEQQFATGKLGMWIFLATEILMFGALFCAYSVYRHNHPDVFRVGHEALSTKLGAINTIILITSSLTMAWGVRAAQLGQTRLLAILLGLTLLGGFGFMGIKAVEYRDKWRHHLGIGPSNIFREQAQPGSEAPPAAPASPSNGAAPAPPATAPAAGPDHSAGAASPQQPAPASAVASALPLPQDANAGTPDAATIRPFTLGPQGLASSVTDQHRQSAAHEHELQNQSRLLARIDQERMYTFFGTYFVMTGLHGIHVLVGMALIFWILLRSVDSATRKWLAPSGLIAIGLFLVYLGAVLPSSGTLKFGLVLIALGVLGAALGIVRGRRTPVLAGQFGPRYFLPVDLVGLYWHLVDLIWIFLFPLLYLIH